jgi:hypothetical protein
VKEFTSQIETNLDACNLNTPPIVNEPIVVEKKVTKLKKSQEMLKVKIDALDKEYAFYKQDIGNINWVGASPKASYPIAKGI